MNAGPKVAVTAPRTRWARKVDQFDTEPMTLADIVAERRRWNRAPMPAGQKRRRRAKNKVARASRKANR